MHIPDIERGGPLFFKVMMDITTSNTEEAIRTLTSKLSTFKVTSIQRENVGKAVSQLRGAYRCLVVSDKVPHDISNCMTYSPSIYWSNMNETPIVVDSGASKSIMPDPSDFVGPIMPMDSPIQGLSATTKNKGIGNFMWHIRDSLGTTTTLETTAYFIPEADIRLFSLQVHFSENKAGSFLMKIKGTTLTLPYELTLLFDHHRGNTLPMATTVSDNSELMIMAFDAFTSQDVSNSLIETHNQCLSHKRSY